MSHAASIDAPGARPDPAQEVMSRIASQVLLMGQQRFEQVLQQPQEDELDFNYDDVEDDGEEE
jgi:hypothetical protein